ncbi:TPA: helix-turn-helix domain-containing protein [Vibrio vulnificus]|nr:helix-turn-helix domain-containing protein [Vibrio vulnificus]
MVSYFMPTIEIIRFNHFAPRKQERYPVTKNGLFFVEQGSLTVTQDSGATSELTAGEFALYNSGQLKEAQAQPGENGFSALALVFSITLLQKFRNVYPLSKIPAQQTDTFFKFSGQHKRIDQLKDMLIEEVERKQNSQAQEHLALALMALMVEKQPELLNMIIRATQFSETQKIIQFIESNIEEEISLEMLAKHMGMSTATLKRRLAAEEMSFSQLLKIKRISHAATQLRVTDKSITTIAYESGFKSAAHFSTAFKAVQQMTPKEFRAKVQQHGKA